MEEEGEGEEEEKEEMIKLIKMAGPLEHSTTCDRVGQNEV